MIWVATSPSAHCRPRPRRRGHALAREHVLELVVGLDRPRDPAGRSSTPLITVFMRSAGIESASSSAAGERDREPRTPGDAIDDRGPEARLAAGAGAGRGTGSAPSRPGRRARRGPPGARSARRTSRSRPRSSSRGEGDERLSPLMNIPAIATSTVRPEISTARPEVAAATSSAEASSRPAARSSRSRAGRRASSRPRPRGRSSGSRR